MLSLKKTVGYVASCVDRDAIFVRSVSFVAIATAIFGVVGYALLMLLTFVL